MPNKEQLKTKAKYKKKYDINNKENKGEVFADKPTKTMTFSVLDPQNYKKLESICRALGSPIRLKIIKQLTEKPMTLLEVARLNSITNSTALFHLTCLIDGGIVENRYLPGVKGKAQIFFVNFNRISFTRGDTIKETTKIFQQETAVGDYIDIDCDFFGIANTEKIIMLHREESFSSARKTAELLWVQSIGAVYYPFENYFAKNGTVEELSFSLELCSETSFYRNDWKSDVTFSINGIDVCTYTSPGDFGGVRGKLNPSWWTNENTQFGNLLDISVRSGGTFMSNEKCSDIGLKDLNLSDGNKIIFGIKIKPTAKYIGGFNIFGKKFGNYEQDIKMSAKYKTFTENAEE